MDRHVLGVNSDQNHDEILQPDLNLALVERCYADLRAMLNHINPSNRCCQAILIVPELPVETGQVITRMIERLNPEVHLTLAIWGNGLRPAAAVQQQMVLGTPGTVRDWSVKYKVIGLQEITVFAMDQADIMMSTQGHQDNCIRINKKLPGECQRILFCDTVDDTVRAFAQRLIPSPHLKLYCKRQPVQ